MAAVEFAIMALVLVFLLLNGIDLAHYTYARMQLENAAQMGAHAAWVTCDPSTVPALTKCGGLTGKVADAVQGTSLRAVQSSVTEGYYCPQASSKLSRVSGVAEPPANCKQTGFETIAPGYYLAIDVAYTYAPLIDVPTVTPLLGTSLKHTAYMRLQ